MPFLELKRQSLLQQAQIAAETLEREHRELEGFIGGHSYANYMKHLLSSDIDPTAGKPAFYRCLFCARCGVRYIDEPLTSLHVRILSPMPGFHTRLLSLL